MTVMLRADCEFAACSAARSDPGPEFARVLTYAVCTNAAALAAVAALARCAAERWPAGAGDRGLVATTASASDPATTAQVTAHGRKRCRA
jgi:hypothetical protein